MVARVNRSEGARAFCYECCRPKSHPFVRVNTILLAPDTDD